VSGASRGFCCIFFCLTWGLFFRRGRLPSHRAFRCCCHSIAVEPANCGNTRAVGVGVAANVSLGLGDQNCSEVGFGRSLASVTGTCPANMKSESLRETKRPTLLPLTRGSIVLMQAPSVFVLASVPAAAGLKCRGGGCPEAAFLSYVGF
jgi:hypothetical protein